jgi:hypothetical protein
LLVKDKKVLFVKNGFMHSRLFLQHEKAVFVHEMFFGKKVGFA